MTPARRIVPAILRSVRRCILAAAYPRNSGVRQSGVPLCAEARNLFSPGLGETTMRRPVSPSRCAIAAVALLAFCLPWWAQRGKIRTVLFVKVKPDQEDNWKATVKDYVEVMKKAG